MKPLVMESLVTSLVQHAREWLLTCAIPLWSQRGRTSSGLFAERMTLAGIPDQAYFRTFVQARQVYSVVVAGQLGWAGPWRELAAETMHTLLVRAKRADGFFVHQLDQYAEVLDSRADLYDQAFMLFALSVAGSALGDESLFDEAECLLDTLEARWRHPLLGFREGEIVNPSIRRQNPHMHLLEAFSSLHNASRRRRFADAADDIAHLCTLHFIDPASAALTEYFHGDWTPLSGLKGRIVEPGHCFEWAWLFESLTAVREDAVAVSDSLTRFGRHHGLDSERGIAINEVLTDGTILDSKARLWPQTERIKAAAARFRRTGSRMELNEVINGWHGLRRYFLPAEPGLWHDRIGEDGSFVEEMVPASALYHISCAINEMCTLCPALF